MKKLKKDEISDALYKKALGFESSDVVEEFVAGENDELKLSKKKITTKFVAPDISAAKALLEFYSDAEQNEFSDLSDEQLENEKQRLILMLKEVEDIKN